MPARRRRALHRHEDHSRNHDAQIQPEQLGVATSRQLRVVRVELHGRWPTWRSVMRVFDVRCGNAVSSIVLADEFGVQVWATGLSVPAAGNLRGIVARNGFRSELFAGGRWGWIPPAK